MLQIFAFVRKIDRERYCGDDTDGESSRERACDDLRQIDEGSVEKSEEEREG